MAPDAAGGRLDTSGAIELLQLGGGQVFLHEPRLDLTEEALVAEVDVEPSPPYAGKVGLLSVGPLSTVTASADPTARTISVSASTVTLDPALASTFNQVFAQPQGKDSVFTAGEALATLSFTAQGQ